MGERQFGLDPAMVNRVANEIATIVNYGVEVCVVIGGGNIFRGFLERLTVWSVPLQIIWEC